MTTYMWAFLSSFCFCRLASLSFSTRVSGTHSSQLKNKAIIDIRHRPQCAIPPPTPSQPILDSSTACNLALAPIMCTLHEPVQITICRGVRLVKHIVPQNCPFQLGDRHPHITHCSLGQEHSLSQTASRSVQMFLYGSQLLCCTMHCQWRKNPQNCPFPLDFRHPAGAELSHRHEALSASVETFWGTTCPTSLASLWIVIWTGPCSGMQTQHAQKFGKDDVCGSGNILVNRQTDTHTCSSQYFATAHVGEVIMLP